MVSANACRVTSSVAAYNLTGGHDYVVAADAMRQGDIFSVSDVVAMPGDIVGRVLE